MLFSSISFIYYFLPVLLLVYALTPKQGKNATLLLFSLAFYFVGEPVYILLLLFSSLVDFINGKIIARYRGTKVAAAALVFSIAVNISLLAVFKYLPLGLSLPLGISFYTFQTMSYSIDVYRGEVEAQNSLLKFAAYVTMFPQLVAGPIVRYETIAEQLESRRVTADGFAEGVRRFVFGLSKKVLLANSLGQLAAAAASAQQSVLMYWLSAVAFTLQIYFDFSGYSDMAIGLGRMLGFHFLENFKYPFAAESVTEFWRRWHISMGSWFRDYVYVPLGGSRVSKSKWIRNVLIVWTVTGLWHGAGWNFILWGLYFAAFLILERMFLMEYLKRLPVLLRYVYTVPVLLFSFVLFQTEELLLIPQRFSGMLGMQAVPLVNGESLYYLQSYGITLLLAVLFCLPEPMKLYRRLSAHPVMTWLEPLLLLGLLALSTAYIVDSSFNPFLYFRF